jgi:ArsR family transcriptional regulator
MDDGRQEILMSGWCDYTELRAELRALSSVASLNILHQLGKRPETNVTDLALALALSQPLVSWHLRNLRRVGLVRTRRQGREVFCSLDRACFAACQHALEAVASPEDPLPPESMPSARMAEPSARAAQEQSDTSGERRHVRGRAGPPSG